MEEKKAKGEIRFDEINISNLFPVSHPVFGSGFDMAKNITQREAYRIGYSMGRLMGEEAGKIIAEGTEGGSE